MASASLSGRVALAGFDVSSDNQHILMVRQIGQDAQTIRVTSSRTCQRS